MKCVDQTYGLLSYVLIKSIYPLSCFFPLGLSTNTKLRSLLPPSTSLPMIFFRCISKLEYPLFNALVNPLSCLTRLLLDVSDCCYGLKWLLPAVLDARFGGFEEGDRSGSSEKDKSLLCRWVSTRSGSFFFDDVIGLVWVRTMFPFSLEELITKGDLVL